MWFYPVVLVLVILALAGGALAGRIYGGRPAPAAIA